MELKQLNNIMGIDNDEDDFYEMEDRLADDENEFDIESFEEEVRTVQNEDNSDDVIEDDEFELEEIPESDW